MQFTWVVALVGLLACTPPVRTFSNVPSSIFVIGHEELVATQQPRICDAIQFARGSWTAGSVQNLFIEDMPASIQQFCNYSVYEVSYVKKLRNDQSMSEYGKSGTSLVLVFR